MKLNVIIQNKTKSKKLPSKKQFQCWADETLSALPKKISAKNSILGIQIVGKKQSANLNAKFRKKNYPTNVLSFPYEDIEDNFGDLVMCAPLIAEQAKEQLKTTGSHWAHLTIHGILHLAGFDHIKKKDAQVMETLEIKILKKLGFDNPY